MKIGLISDVHGNVQALGKCLDLLAGHEPDDIYMLGDAVGYLPWGDEVVQLLREHGVLCIKGNHDAMLLDELPLSSEADRIAGISRQRRKTSEASFDFLRSLPVCRELICDGRGFFFVHGAPGNPFGEYVYPDHNMAFARNSSEACFILGHTHVPFLVQAGDSMVLNPGSCGLPRDAGDLPSFAVLDTASLHAAVYRFRFDTLEILSRALLDEVAPEVIRCLERRSESFYGDVVY